MSRKWVVMCVSFVVFASVPWALASPPVAQPCGGNDCVVRSLSAPRTPSSLGNCTAGKRGQLAYERAVALSDGGVTGRGAWVSCQSDGGWAELGAGSPPDAGAGDSEWLRSGAVLVTDAGVRAVFRAGVTNAGLELYEAGTLRAGLHLHSSGNPPRLLTSSMSLEVRNTGGYWAGLAASYLQAESVAGYPGVRVNTGARVVLNGAAGTVYLDTDGTDVRTGGPLRINTTNTAAISRSPRAVVDWATAGGAAAIAAQECEGLIVTVTGAAVGADCIATLTPLRPGLFVTCCVEDGNSANVHVCNATTSALNPNPGADLSVRVLNP